MIAKLLLLHFIADFLLQPREMGKKKSQDFRWLYAHLVIQFLVFLPFTNLKFAFANIVLHGLIDWNLWRLYKLSAHLRIDREVSAEYAVNFLDTGKHDPAGRKANYDAKVAAWQYWEDHLFYTTIGFDQLLHGLTLVFLAGQLL